MDDPGILVPIIAVSIGLFAVIGRLFIRPWLAHQEKKLELQSRLASEAATRADARNDRLEQRVAVLERILTDRSDRLADEIDRLRDKPLN
ncbi:MAG: hypothetical protein EOP60_18890 [Sphingomonadales bacterium]|nr:MAG: hypothetical protein EOP60_18890 [Sphingomonadales bacterium]